MYRILYKTLDNIRHKIQLKRLEETRKRFGSIGKKVTINLGGTLISPENITLADNIYVGPDAFLEARGNIEIQENVIIAQNVTILTSNHNYENAKMLPYDEYYILKKVVIEKNVWIGANVSICPGVTIGEGSVIALGSVVTKDVPKYSIMGGNPAKVLKMRDINSYNKLDQDKSYFLRFAEEGKAEYKYIRQDKKDLT